MTKKARLLETRRRLAPHVALQGDEPFRMCDAAIARCLVEVIDLVVELVDDDERASARGRIR